LAFVLAPLGTEVIRRRIVFVDLALAQIAALGAAIGTAVEWDPIATSVVFTVVGAGLLAVPASSARLPQEAVMGVVYAVAAAAAVLVVSKAPHGDADFLHLLFGNILAVSNHHLVVLAGLAIAVAIWRAVSRRIDPASVGRGATMLFYLLLGGAIAAAIRSAGVLMVFTYLVAPALTIRVITIDRAAGAVSIVIAAACGVLGLWASYRWDLPSGSAIVAAFGFCLGMAAIMTRVWRASRKTDA
jgi:zinc/manganese transport system permease protein